MLTNRNKVISKIAFRNLVQSKLQSYFIFLTFTAAIMLVTVFMLTALAVQRVNDLDAQRYYQAVFYPVEKGLFSAIENADQIESVIFTGALPDVRYYDRYIMKISYFSDFFFEELDGVFPEHINEILITEGSLKYLPEGISLGDQLNLDLGDGSREYKITGIATLSNEDLNTISIYCSDELLNHVNKEEYQDYMLYLFLKDAQNMDYSEIKDHIYQIADINNIPEENVIFSNRYESITQEYNIEEIIQMILVMAAVLFAAYLVVFSIFYISVNKKIAEYGQLRAIGMVKKQIYKMILLEGILIAVPGIVTGVIGGGIIGYIMNPRGWHLPYFLIVALLDFIFGLITLRISIYYPAKTASSISTIEAMRYNGSVEETIKKRKHDINYSAFNFARLNLKRSRKKSIMTIISLSLCGIIFICCASLQSSISAENIVENLYFQQGSYKMIFRGDQDLYKDLESEAQNYGTGALQSADNVLDSALREQITSINGVRGIKEWNGTTGIFSFENTDIMDQTTIWGYTQEDQHKLDQAVISGTADYNELINNNGIILNASGNVMSTVYGYEPVIGDNLAISFLQSDGTVHTSNFTLMGITGSSDGFQNIIRMPLELLQKNTNYNLALEWEIITEDTASTEVETDLLELLADLPELDWEVKTDLTTYISNQYDTIFFALYVIVMVLAGFGIISLINLTLTNHLVRKKETAILLSIGMTRKQLKNNRLIENEILVLISLIFATGLGTPISYFIVSSLVNTGTVQEYQFPIFLYLVFYVTVFTLQAFLSLYLNKNSRHSITHELRFT